MTYFVSNAEFNRLMQRRNKKTQKEKKKADPNPMPEIPAEQIQGTVFESSDDVLIEFEILMTPPTVNHYWVEAGYHGRKYLSHRAHHFRAVIQRFVKPLNYSGEVQVFMEYHVPDRIKRDADNVVKPIFDALMKAQLICDDSQISKFFMMKQPVFKGGKLKIKVVKGQVGV
ncbi:RusA family crossover junction endodeoxyribonuclease [Acinetobacter brisouii]|uniref:RusA family crossover junction endodeoxyribonuclease n=1 Tax=Acinetobacter brisouii TaxID=396323 RepID=UPI0012507A22|nr:RusA family crossover junction endodeoxyribonuclease [Acinetobacter brisouii]